MTPIFARIPYWEKYLTEREVRVMCNYKSYADELIARGEAMGEAMGEARGEARGEAKTIIKMYKNRMSVDMISKVTEISVENIKKIIGSQLR